MNYCTSDALIEIKTKMKFDFDSNLRAAFIDKLKAREFMAKRRRRYAVELKELDDNIRDILEEIGPFLNPKSSPDTFNVSGDPYLERVQDKVTRAGGKLLSRRYSWNHWDEHRQIRISEQMRGYIIDNGEGIIEFNHPNYADRPYSIKVLWFYLRPEHQGNFFKTKRLIRLAFDCLLDDYHYVMYGTTSEVPQQMYQFDNSKAEENLLTKREDDFVNNLQKMYQLHGAMPANNEVFWFKPEGIQIYLNALEGDEKQIQIFRHNLRHLLNNKKSIYTLEEREYQLAILEGALVA